MVKSEQVNYSRAPITESVIDFRFRTNSSSKDIDKIGKKLKKNYPHTQPLQHINFMIHASGGNVGVQQSTQGMRLNSADQADVALITPSGISAARLAPYQGWETLRDKSKEIWHIWRETTSISLVSRIGTRTINRIDIPLSNNSQIDLQSYVTVFPQLPKELNQAWTAYLLQVSLPTHKDGWNVTITSNLLPMSPLIKHLSILLDIDVFRTTEIPSKDDDFWAVVEEARAIKNHIFESCITNETRGLIS